jgi:hypothetical protein
MYWLLRKRYARAVEKELQTLAWSAAQGISRVLNRPKCNDFRGAAYQLQQF